MDDKAIKSLLIILSCIFLNEALGANASQVDSLISKKNLNPYIPHAYLSGYEGSNGLAKADILAPLLLREDRNLFIYGQGRYSDYANYGDSQPYSASFGVGFRQIVNANPNDSRLFGMYLLADYSNSPMGHKYWDLSPGFETLGEVDFRINGYIPFKKSYAESIGTKFDHFYGHEEFHRVYKNYEEQGTGLDAEVGMKLFSIGQMPIKGFIDGYFFDTENSGQIKGVGGRITVQPTRYLTFELKNVYDNVQHNIFMGGIKLYLNGLTQGLGNTKVDGQGIKPRLYDPIERNFSSIGSGSATPYAHGKEYRETTLFRDHIIFIRDPDINGIEGNGTYENPYIYGGSEGFQTIPDAAKSKFPDYSFLFFAPGTYDLGSNPISLHSYQLVFGRSDTFWEPAGAGEVKLIGSLYMQDAKHGGFRNFQLLNREGAFAYGIDINSAQPDAKFVFDGVIIGEGMDGIDPTNNGFAIGLYVHDINTGSATFDIGGSNFYGIGNAVLNLSGTGVLVNNDNAIDSNLTLAINNSNFYGFNTYTSYPFWSSGLTIVNYSNGAVSIGNIANSKFISDGYGLYFEGESDNPVSSLTIGDITNSYFDGSYWSAIYLYHSNSNIGNIIIGNISNSYIKETMYIENDSIGLIKIGDILNSNFVSAYNAVEIDCLNGKSDVLIGNIINSNFNGSGTFGVFFVYDAGNITIDSIKNSNFISLGKNSGNHGLYIFGNGDINIPIIESSNFEAMGPYGWAAYIYATNIIIDNITNSNFLSGGGYGLYLAGVYYYSRGATHISVGNIENSTFINNGGRGAGLWVEVENANIENIINSNFEDTGVYGSGLSMINWYYNDNHNLRIGKIEDSIFTANNSYGRGLQIGGGYSMRDNINSKIDSITNSTFNANGFNGTAAYFGGAGGYGSWNYFAINSASIAYIQNSIFNCMDSAGKELWINAKHATYGDPAIPYTDGQSLYDLLKLDNVFNATIGKYVCILGNCYTGNA